ncbi:MAG TPA: glycosyltransferase [Chloroflexia bacterium]|nr:glycosyltransferase [Chloroflexia bacterium]
MKILYLYKDYYPVLGGIENYTRQLAEGMLERGHSVEVLVTNTGRGTTHENLNGVPVLKAGRWVNISSAPLSPGFAYAYLKRLYRVSDRPDIVHLQFPYPPGELAWLLGSYSQKFGPRRPRTVLTYHSDIVRQKKLLTVYAPFLRQVLKRVDVILATSPNYIESSLYLKPLAEKCRVVPLGVDVARFSQPEQVNSSFQPDAGPILLFAGRLRYYKGLQYLIKAMPEIRPDARLVVVGVGPMEENLKALVVELGLQQRVIFAGEVADEALPDYYAAADIFILPACERSEAFGMVQLEAMAAGKPVISTELGTGTSYVNQDGLTGLVVPPHNAPALAHAANQLLADEQKRLEMGRRGQERARAEFSLLKMYDQVETIYREVLAAK